MDELEFEWDPAKARQVLEEHNIAFEDAATVFRDPLAAEIYDEEHSDDEDRFVTIGTMANGNEVLVVHTPRGSKIRLITAREPTKAEKRAYEQG